MELKEEWLAGLQCAELGAAGRLPEVHLVRALGTELGEPIEVCYSNEEAHDGINSIPFLQRPVVMHSDVGAYGFIREHRESVVENQIVSRWVTSRRQVRIDGSDRHATAVIKRRDAVVILPVRKGVFGKHDDLHVIPASTGRLESALNLDFAGLGWDREFEVAILS